VHKISRSPWLRLGRNLYNATTHALAGFRGEGPRERDGKREDREKDRVMQGMGGRRREKMERRGRKGDLLHKFRGDS